MAWMLVLYAAFVTSVAVSADREALLAHVQAMTEGGDVDAAVPRKRDAPMVPVLRHASAH